MKVLAIAGLLLATCTSPPMVAAPTILPSPAFLLAKSGTANYDSAPFTTQGNWELDWSYDCSAVRNGHDSFIVAVYRQLDVDPSRAGLFDTITPGPGNTFGVTLETHQTTAGAPKGTFYLKVLSECSWHVLAKAL